jgi:hypothetical protein
VPHYKPQRLYVFALYLLLAGSSACASAAGKDYFPLADNSKWTYTGTYKYADGRQVPMRANARVEGRIIIRGKEYFKYVISPGFVGVPNAPKLSENVRYYRVGADGIFLLPGRNPDGPELMELALPTRPGVKWLNGDAEALAESAGTVKAGGREYADCLKVRYRSSDGSVETEYYLAPGVGIIKASFVNSNEPKAVMELTLEEYKR